MNKIAALCFGIVFSLPAWCQTNTLESMNYTYFFKITLIFFAVLCLSVLFIYFLKRVLSHSMGQGGMIQIKSVLPLSNKEKIILIEVGEKHIVVGVTTQSMSALHVFEDKIDTRDHEQRQPFHVVMKKVFKGDSE